MLIFIQLYVGFMDLGISMDTDDNCSRLICEAGTPNSAILPALNDEIAGHMEDPEMPTTIAIRQVRPAVIRLSSFHMPSVPFW